MRVENRDMARNLGLLVDRSLSVSLLLRIQVAYDVSLQLRFLSCPRFWRSSREVDPDESRQGWNLTLLFPVLKFKKIEIKVHTLIISTSSRSLSYDMIQWNLDITKGQGTGVKYVRCN